jgi:5-keto 4-deoxyuronate isomerase
MVTVMKQETTNTAKQPIFQNKLSIYLFLNSRQQQRYFHNMSEPVHQ